MSSVQKQYQVPIDCHWLSAPGFHIGQKVFVSAEHICTSRPTKKLSEEYLGPYEIIAKPSTHSFTLWLPKHMHAIHLVFHVSQLEPEIPNQIPNCVQPVPSPIEIDNKLEYEIAEISDSKINN